MADDRAFALEEAEHALRQLGASTLDPRDWDGSRSLLDALRAAITAGDTDAVQRATGQLAVLLAVRQPPRIRGAADDADDADDGEGHAPQEVLERINELVHAIVVRRDDDAAGAPEPGGAGGA